MSQDEIEYRRSQLHPYKEHCQVKARSRERDFRNSRMHSNAYGIE